MRHALLPILAAAALWSGSVLAEALPAVTPELLVSERVQEELGAAIPDEGEISLRFMSPLPAQVVGISNFAFDSRNGRFRADFITGDGMVEATVGMAVVELEIPVPARRIDAGKIIEEADLVSTRLPTFQVGSLSITDPDDMIGMQARRTLAQGRPVQEHSIGAPIVAERGSSVTIILKEGPISVTAPGRLLEDGARGQQVRVINNISSKTLQAYVLDSETVEIRL